jgi:hypothetical protein
MEGAKAAILWYLKLILSQFYRLVAADPEELRPHPNLSTFPWVLVGDMCGFGWTFGSSLLFVTSCRKRKNT